MSEFLPLFPLPNVVLFPGVFLPLHVFEPRYRQLVADALMGDRLIGMVLLRPGWESDYQGRPPVFPVGCSGVITHVEQLEDGRYNIVLRGLERFRIVEEDHECFYRRAVVESLVDEHQEADDRVALMNQRSKLEALLAEVVDQGGSLGVSGRGGHVGQVGRVRQAGQSGQVGQAGRVGQVGHEERGRRESGASYARTTSAMTDEDLVHALAQYLDLDPLEKQALLQRDNLRMRAESLVELLEMKILIARMPGLPNVAH
jgi:Lon protease-like protein